MDVKAVPVGVSARHIHLTKEHIDSLFGTGYSLKMQKPLSQPGLFAAEETVSAIGPKGRLDRIRVVGPDRKASQLEISKTDSLLLGVHPPVRLSGNHEQTPGILIVGPAGKVLLERGVMIAARHIHFHTTEAARWGIQDRQLLRVRVGSEDRAVVFERVIARVSDRFALDMHMDTDEANAAFVQTGDTAVILD
ncbi:MAG: hypothetical protein K0Q59_3119 [Paenibacillus sp.]|nr:hypothetical protein [Paenibacillus sp.]